MSSLSESNVQTIWVVAKLVQESWDNWETEVEERGYWAKEYADKRAKHIRELDGLEASVWPVRFELPLGAAAVAFNPPIPWGPVTAANGLELNAYHVPWLDEQPRLSQTVSDAWLAWRQQQADLGNLDEAGRAGPSKLELAELYQETLPNNALQQQLYLPGILEPVH